jgi:hypothetical protein
MDSHCFSIPRLVEKSETLTWEVEVLRRGQVVDTLQVNATNFPPRLNKKKKIVWQLPMTGNQLPRFGEHEKERLWEMFKQQKKERRKKGKQHDESILDDLGVSRDQSLADDDMSDSNNNYSESLHSENRDTKQEAEETPNISQRSSGSLHPAPPPGFTVSEVSSPRNSDSLPYDSHLIAKTLERDTPTAALKPERAPAQVSLSSTSSTSTESPPQPNLHSFPTDPINTANLSAHVATTFIQALTKGQIDQWLAFYLERAPSTLMVGQAHALCSSPDERRQQWEALQQPFWECQGWTSQDCGNYQTLVVLTGRTMQPTGTFFYNLTLMLTPQYQIRNSILSLSLLG